jgi:transposase-like protein
MARPTSLTPEVQTAIVAAILDGNYRVTAAQKAGVCERSLYNWLERGATGEAPFAEFLQAVKTAEADAESALLSQIRHAQPAVTGEGGHGADIWQAKAWIMERRWPKRWAQRVRQAVTEELDAFTDRLQRRLDDATYRKVLDASREDASGEGTDARH